MKHRQVEAFRSVMQSGTTAQAAQLMSVTQPAVSRLIADLEYHLNFKLFERSRGRLHPTPEALKFYNAVERFFIGIEELERSARQIREGSPTELKICATPALSTSIVPTAITAFRKLHSNVAFQLESASFSQIALRLQTHQANLGIAHASPVLPGLRQEILINAAHVCAMHETHPLARKSKIVPQDLEGESILRILPEGQVNWDSTKAVLDESGIRFRMDVATQSSHTGYSLIAQNLAIGLIEPFAAGPWRNNGVVTRPFEPRIPFDYVVALPELQPRSSMLEKFIELLREVARTIEPGKLDGQFPGTSH